MSLMSLSVSCPQMKPVALWPRLLVSLLVLATSASVDVRCARPFRLLAWNVENLFDTRHDEGFDDAEFLPDGPRQWTPSRYWRKLKDIARVIAGEDLDVPLPDVIGLCEVENDSVLETLTHRSPLRALGYEYVVTHSADARGVDVGFLYQPTRFRLLEHHSLRVPSQRYRLRPTRDILYVKGLVQVTPRDQQHTSTLDTLHIFVVHLPSRAGGYTGDRNRNIAAATLWSAVDSLQAQGTDRIVVMGDFNADVHDRIFRNAPLKLTDAPDADGTYCYRGFWQWIDHILVSPDVTTLSPATPLALPWLLEDDKTYGGLMPFRTYRGPTYHGGVSDHLPLLIDLQF